jgi:hypothetical protein
MGQCLDHHDRTAPDPLGTGRALLATCTVADVQADSVKVTCPIDILRALFNKVTIGTAAISWSLDISFLPTRLPSGLVARIAAVPVLLSAHQWRAI